MINWIVLFKGEVVPRNPGTERESVPGWGLRHSLGHYVRSTLIKLKSAVFLAFFSCTIYSHQTLIIMPRAKKPAKQFVCKYDLTGKDFSGETFTMPSLAVPDQSYTIKEMIQMSVRGEIPPLAMSAFHGIDVDLDAFDGRPHNDLTELDEFVIKNDRSNVGESEAITSESEAAAPTSEAQASEETTSEASEGEGEE